MIDEFEICFPKTEYNGTSTRMITIGDVWTILRGFLSGSRSRRGKSFFLDERIISPASMLDSVMLLCLLVDFFDVGLVRPKPSSVCDGIGLYLNIDAGNTFNKRSLLCSGVYLPMSQRNTETAPGEGIMGTLYACNAGNEAHRSNCRSYMIPSGSRKPYFYFGMFESCDSRVDFTFTWLSCTTQTMGMSELLWEYNIPTKTVRKKRNILVMPPREKPLRRKTTLSG